MEGINESAPGRRGAEDTAVYSDSRDYTMPPAPNATEIADRLAVGVSNDLRELKGWMLWKRGQAKPGGKFDKVPYYAAGGKRFGAQGSPEDLAKLATFDVALARLRKGGYDGLGLAMLSWGVVGLDFDNCRDEAGITPWVSDLCRDTYAETSPSGNGVRAFYRGAFPDRKNHAERIETFYRSGFLTVTGARLNGCDLAELPERVAGALGQRLGPDKARSDSADVLSKACGQDPTLARLNELGMVQQSMGGGKFDIACPWESEHSTTGGAGDTVYFAAHTGGYASGNFDCKHAHCAERPQAEFREALGLGARPGAEDATAADVEAEPGVDNGTGGGSERRELPHAMDRCAYHGIVGELVTAIEPHTEADPAALLVQVLVAFGILIGRAPYVPVEGDRHCANLFALLVGDTAKGRKGTSWGRIRSVFERVSGWPTAVSGLSSGEGLKYRVRDPRAEMVKNKKSGEATLEVIDEGVQDKRLLVTEPEFAQVLRVVTRQGNTLSSTVRNAWDTGNLANLTKNDPITATGAHIGIIGHVTVDELRAELTQTDTTARAEAQAIRLAMIYALLDEKVQIDRPHLLAALAVWEYAEASARYVFGSILGDPVAERIGAALDLLDRRRLVRRRSQETGGRPTEVWECV